MVSSRRAKRTEKPQQKEWYACVDLTDYKGNHLTKVKMITEVIWAGFYLA